MSNKLDRLERKIGYTFKDQELLLLALTHRSLGGRNNERLEFLGDSILSLIVCDILYKRFAESGEGDLSKPHARSNSTEWLKREAKHTNLYTRWVAK